MAYNVALQQAIARTSCVPSRTEVEWRKRYEQMASLYQLYNILYHAERNR